MSISMFMSLVDHTADGVALQQQQRPQLRLQQPRNTRVTPACTVRGRLYTVTHCYARPTRTITRQHSS